MPASSLLPTGRADLPPARRADNDASPWPRLLAAALGVTAARVAVFNRMMDEQGAAVDSARLFFDQHYAYKRFALAHTSSDEALKALAVEFFERYQQLERRRHDVSAFTRGH